MVSSKTKISVDIFVATICNEIIDHKWLDSVRDEDKDILNYTRKIEEKEEVAYKCFSLINAFEYGLDLEKEWQHELLNVLLVQRVAKHFDQAKMLSFEEAEDFLCGRITYYFEVWQKYNTSEDRPKLMMAIACMLVYHKPYEEYMSKREEEINWSPEFSFGIGLSGTSHTVEFAKAFLGEISQKYQVVFSNNDAIRHTVYVIHYNELINKWKKINN